MKNTPIWSLLVERGIFKDRKTAESWIMAGKVLADSVRIDKPGQLVAPTADIVVRGLDRKYVSRGGLKLEGALADFGLDVTDAVALDAGASTGGFTDCLLQRGAARVYAVEADAGRLAGKLRLDPRVVCIERTNIGDAPLLTLDPRPTIAAADLSCIPLRTAIPILAEILAGQGELVCLVKEFELSDSHAGRSGPDDAPDVYRSLLQDLARFVTDRGFTLMGVTHSHILGNKGGREFFIRVALGPLPVDAPTEADVRRHIDTAARAVMELDWPPALNP